MLALWMVALAPLDAGETAAQTRPTPSADSRQGDARVAPTRRAAIRFVTTNDYPPFNYFAEDGTLSGLNVDIARTVCSELAALCDIQVRPWDDLLTAIRRGEADAAIASHAVNGRLMSEFSVSDRYYHTPGRFVGHTKGPTFDQITPATLDGKRIAVARGTAHEAFLRAFFTSSVVQVFENVDLARDAIRSQQVDLLFDDGIGLVFWLNGEASKLCCEFKGGPFVEPRYFGDGVGIVMARDDAQLKVLIDGALRRLREARKIEELMSRYFPLQPY